MLPFLIFGSSALLACMAAALLPETLGALSLSTVSSAVWFMQKRMAHSINTGGHHAWAVLKTRQLGVQAPQRWRRYRWSLTR